jgi:hypothetical protein
MRGQTSKPGDTRVSPNGYHYTRTEEGWVLTARLIAGETRGEPLAKNERVRFVDGDRTNLDPANIMAYIVREGSRAKKAARIKSRIEELQAELQDIENEEEQ